MEHPITEMEDKVKMENFDFFNNKCHEVCGTCGCTVGHGCPESEHCDCDDDDKDIA